MGGPADIAIIAVVVVVLFGGAKLAGLGKSAGEGIREFKKAMHEDEANSTKKEDLDESKKDPAETKK
jgi:sec-independent protein translocase protein TatA